MGRAETCSSCCCCCDYGHHTYELHLEEGETGGAEGLAVKKRTEEESRGNPQTPVSGSDSRRGALLELDI